jgi:hypothetical protein
MRRRGRSRRHSVSISLPWTSTIEAPPELAGLMWSRRPVEWGQSRLRSILQHAANGLRVLRAGNRPEAIIFCSSGMDVVFAGLAHRLFRRSSHLVVVDFLLPPTAPRRLLRCALRGVDEFVVIRTGDVKVLGSLGVPAGRCRFVAFAAPMPVTNESAPLGEYVYSGGCAQRDWVTLSDALGQSGIPALVSCPDEELHFTSNVLKLPLVGPEQGRKFLGGSRFLVQSIIDNEQPSGPLLILDAFSAGKPVVASDVNGTRDYIDDGVNGILVPPHNPAAMAEAISGLFANDDLVDRMAGAARRTAADLSSGRFWSEVLAPWFDSRQPRKGEPPD